MVDCCIIGWAFQCDKSRKAPIEEIKSITSRDQIDQVVESWSGRWLLIWHDILRMDACGLLGCFYTDDGIFSESVALIDEVKRRRSISPRIEHGFGLDYYPGSRTMQVDTLRLLPSESISLTTAKLENHHLYPEVPALANDEQRINLLVETMSTMLRNVDKNYPGELVLTLTGGYDSRTMMAILEKTAVPYRAVTLEHGNISLEDKVLPGQLANLCGASWKYVPRVGKGDKARYKAFDEHCGGMAVDEDRNFYAYRQYPENEGRIGIVRCGTPEVTFPLHHWFVLECGTDIEKYSDMFVNVRGRRDIRESLEQWLVEGWHDPELSLLSDYYWNMRAGCWLSSVEQSLTILEGTDVSAGFN